MKSTLVNYIEVKQRELVGLSQVEVSAYKKMVCVKKTVANEVITTRTVEYIMYIKTLKETKSYKTYAELKKQCGGGSDI